MSSTAPSTEVAADIDEGWVEKTFLNTVETEERVIFMEKLVKLGVGVAEVEHFFKGVTETCRNTKNKVRKENLIVGTMKEKLNDAYDERNLWRQMKARTISKVRKVWGRGSSRYKSLFKKVINNAKARRAELKMKYKLKVKHLHNKFKEDVETQQIPPEIQKYSAADCFNPDYEPEPDNTDMSPLVYGEVSLDEDEKETLKLDPKFAVLDTLTLEDFEVEVECCLAKQRWNKMSTDKDSDNSDISEEERIQNEIEDAEERLIYNPVTKTVDFRKYRATDAPMNANLKLPRAQTQEYEVGLELRRSEWTT